MKTKSYLCHALLVSVLCFAAISQAAEIIFRPGPGLNNGTDTGTATAGKDASGGTCENPAANYGSQEGLVAAPQTNCNSCNTSTWLRFDVSTLPSDVTHVYLGFTHLPHTTYCYSNCSAAFYFYPVTSDWSEMTVSRAVPPTRGAAAFGPVNITFPNDLGNREYEITDLYRQWKAGAIINYGIEISSPTIGCNNAAVMFLTYSSDAATVSNRPYLRIVTPKADQTITFGALANRTYGDPPFSVSASASSGLPVTFSIVSGPAYIAGNTVTITGTGTVTVRASQAGNDAYNPAPAVDRSFQVTCAYSLPTSQSVAAIASIGTLNVTTASGCTWTASSNVAWITITSGSSGSGNGTVAYAVAANPSGGSRIGTLTVAGQTFTVTQAGLAVPSCTLTASPSAITAGQSSTLTVTCNPAATSYAWTNTGFAATASTGTVSPTITTIYSVIGSNAAGSGNTASTAVTVTCTYSLSPASRSAAGSATTGTLSVTTTSSCAWTASSNVAWITITSGSSGSGNGTVAYAVAANPSGSSRTGTLTIAGQIFTVTQAGITVPVCTLTATPTTITAGQSSTLTATCGPAATSYTWTNTGFAATASGGTVSPTVTTTYSVIGSNAAGSGNTASANITVAISGAETVTYTYDGNGQLISANYGGGNAVFYSYDASGNPATVTATGTGNACAASVSPSLVLHIPIVTFNGSNYWADLQYNSADSNLTIAGAGIVSDVGSYGNCTASTLTSGWSLHIPVAMLNGVSYWFDLQMSGSAFVITGSARN